MISRIAPAYMFGESEQFNLARIEEEVIAFWEKDGTFEKSLEATKHGSPYTFYDGPPFATGLPHYGHILASTIKDLIPRYQTMQGHFVRRRWGWDCHGLPIEEIVERKLGISGKKQIEEIGIATFNEACQSAVLQYVADWRKMVRRMGRWVDFDNSYKTMDSSFMESVWWAFKQCWDKELVYEGRKVLLYCPRCETPLSNFEVAMDNSYKDVTEEAVIVRFKVLGSRFDELLPSSNADHPTYLLAWTTTPWTLPGNVALAVGPDIDYSLVQAANSLYIVASGLVGKLFTAETVLVKKEFKGRDLVGIQYQPLFDVPTMAGDKSYRVQTADFVTTEEGTGIVHIAPVHGEDDYALGVREGLPIVPLLDEKGTFNTASPELVRGQYFKKGEKEVKADLEARGLLFDKKENTHSYPHCWRCSTALFYNAIPAWFVNIQKIKPDLLKSNEQINWYPAHLKHGRYAKSVEAAPDWNISRNRYWGNPIPVWKCEACKKEIVVGSLADIRAQSIKKNEFIFVRHGDADHIVDGYCGPAEDTAEYTSHLTEKGRQEVEELGKSLAGTHVDVIISSPLARMKETIEIIKKYVDAPVIFSDGLKDLNHGGLMKHGAWEEMIGKAPDTFNAAFPGGETRNEVKARMAKFLREINETYSGKTILIASHGDPLWMMQGALRGLTSGEMEGSPYPGVGERYVFDWSSIPFNNAGEVDMHRPYIDEIALRCDCGGEARRVPEIFDSWFEAGSMPFAEDHYPFENKETFESRYPAQFVAEYIAQTRAWFYLMHVMGQVLFSHPPFEHVVTTGTILAEDGSKMSKSKNNFPDPWLLIDKYGVDSLRFYLMNSVVMQADNLNFSEEEVGGVYRKIGAILWNVWKYFATYAKEAGWKNGTQKSVPTVLDQWINVRTGELIADVTNYLDGYDTVRATRVIEEYIQDLSTWYVRRSRGRNDAAFFETLFGALRHTAQVLAPFMPHLADALWMNLSDFDNSPVQSVHLSAWPTVRELEEGEKILLEGMAQVRAVASVGLAARKQANIPVRQSLARLKIAFETGKALSDELKDILLAELNVKKIDEEITESADIKTYEVNALGIKSLVLDWGMTPELKLEGLVRGLERFVQGMRKEQGLKVGEQVVLTYETESDDMKKALELFDCKKTYVQEIKAVSLGADAGAYTHEGASIKLAFLK